METHPGESVVNEEKFPNSRKSSHRWVCGDFGISEGNITGREKKKTQNMHLPAIASREVAQMLVSATRERGSRQGGV